MRGEYWHGRSIRTARAGSSPHAWGIPGNLPLDFFLQRFIPTCVGNTFAALMRSSRSSVHPHMRGEYDQRVIRAVAAYGSSPHAWGIRAGGPQGPGGCPVHPHMRGEYFLWTRSPQPCDGSSPHAWGIPPCRRPGCGQRRFIPTCVGNTESEKRLTRHGSVHPHMRGEYPWPQVTARKPCGSSPHAWGIPNDTLTHMRSFRFIPTCVGNTPPGGMTTCARSVHPHMRGEYLFKCFYI